MYGKGVFFNFEVVQRESNKIMNKQILILTGPDDSIVSSLEYMGKVKRKIRDEAGILILILSVEYLN